MFKNLGKDLVKSFNTGVSYFLPAVVIGGVSVSYTHLDVYKRQVYTQANQVRNRQNKKDDVYHGYHYKAVSYTHLDVYKRQPIAHIKKVRYRYTAYADIVTFSYCIAMHGWSKQPYCLTKFSQIIIMFSVPSALI